jgi:hypothetical protein
LCSIMFSTMKLSCGLMKKTLIVSWSRRSLAPHLDSLTSTCDLQISHFCCFS